MSSDVLQRKFRAALFDVDGTLVDSVNGVAQGLLDAYLEFGKSDATIEWTRSMVGIPLRDQMRIAVGPTAPESEVERAMEFTMTRYAIHLARPAFFEPTMRALNALRNAGIKTALVTSKNAAEMIAFEPKFPAWDAIDATVCASDVRHGKPAPDSALLACEKLGVSPSEAFMIGDSIFDVQCAKGAGVAAFAVTYGAMPRERLLADEPDAIFETPEAFEAWIEHTFLTQHEKENHDLVGSSG